VCSSGRTFTVPDYDLPERHRPLKAIAAKTPPSLDSYTSIMNTIAIILPEVSDFLRRFYHTRSEDTRRVTGLDVASEI
jgi:hypothetical protein